MKTDDLIKRLAAEPPARKTPWGLWLAGAALGAPAAMTLVVLLLPMNPLRPDLPFRVLQPRFLGETLLWLAMASATFALVYRLSIPGLWRRRDALWALVPAVLLAAALLFRPEPKGAGADWMRELDWYRGLCGPMILWAGIVQAVLLAWVVRKAAPTRLAVAGFWIAFGSGAFGSFLMQFVCTKENFAHVVLWHAAPLAVLAAAGVLLGRKALRW